MFDAVDFRNLAAESGVELVPSEAQDFVKAYNNIKKSIEEAIKTCPTYYEDLCNRTLEEKLKDIKIVGDGMTLKDYNEAQNVIKLICELEGYV